jgi:pilus assembly protein Flp/PilA
MRRLIRQFLSDENGATAVEYGLIVAVLSLVIVGGVGHASDAIKFLFSDNESKLVDAFNQ